MNRLFLETIYEHNIEKSKKKKITFVMWYDCTLNLQIPVPETVSSVPPVDFEFEFEILFALPQWV